MKQTVATSGWNVLGRVSDIDGAEDNAFRGDSDQLTQPLRLIGPFLTVVFDNTIGC